MADPAKNPTTQVRVAAPPATKATDTTPPVPKTTAPPTTAATPAKSAKIKTQPAAATGQVQPPKIAPSKASTTAPSSASAKAQPKKPEADSGVQTQASTKPKDGAKPTAAQGQPPAPVANNAPAKGATTINQAAPAEKSAEMTPSQVQQLKELRVQCEERKIARAQKEQTLQTMQSLVSLQQQFTKTKASTQKQLENQNTENTRLEKELISVQVQIKRENLIKELNTMKAVKKSDAIINQAMKDQGVAVQKEINAHSTMSVQLQQQMDDIMKQIQFGIPESVRKTETEINLLKAQKSKMTKLMQEEKDKINEVNIQDVQLSTQGTAKLSTQVNPASKVAVEEKDIITYAGVLEKIQARLEEAFKSIPSEYLPQPSPVRVEEEESEEEQQQVETPVKSPEKTPMTPYSPAATSIISPSPTKSDKSPFSGGMLTDVLGKGLFGDLTASLGKAVEGAAKSSAIRVQKDKSEFVQREQSRINMMLQDKLTSMKKIVEYEKNLENFADEHKRLNDDINQSKAANSLVQECMNGLYQDKQYMAELRQQVEEVEEEQPEEGDAEEGEEEVEEQIEEEQDGDEEGEEEGEEEVENEEEAAESAQEQQMSPDDFEEQLTPTKHIFTDPAIQESGEVEEEF